MCLKKKTQFKMKQNKKVSFQEINVDILITGGGLIGSLAALNFAHSGFSVGVLEKKQTTFLTESNRAFSIALGSVAGLESLNLWQDLKTCSAPIRKIVVSKQGSRQGLIYDPEMIGSKALGYIVREQEVRKQLAKRLKQHSKIIFLENVCVENQTQDAFFWSFHLKNHPPIKAKLWLAAEGAYSESREKMHINKLQVNYDQIALVFSVKHEHSHQYIAFEHFTDYGPLAFLPLGEKESAVVWSLKSYHAHSFLNQPSAIPHALLHHFGTGFGHFTLSSKLKSYPLVLLRPYPIYKDRFLLIGDAAHVIHPVAGQGLNLGVRDVFVLGEHLKSASRLGLDIGSRAVLKAYARRRSFDHHTMLMTTHGLAKALTFSWLTPFWHGGAFLLNELTPLKKRIVRHAVGFGIDPSLDALGERNARACPKTC